MSAPERLGDYRLLERLGAGGMGTVYRAEHVETGVRYAVKTLETRDPELIARFEREGEAQARVDRHPNVVRVHSMGRDGGRRYLVLDLVEGGDLGDRLRTGPMPPEAAVALTVALARGLAHVHAAGVLHRDIKPANVLLDGEGTPRLVDFGLARVKDGEALTETGSILGTPAYMAPEQVEGRRDAIGPVTDVYGLGALLYHCLSGHPPFRGGSPLVVLNKVLHADPAPLEGVPGPLAALCRRALSKRAGDRPASAAAFAEELEGLSLETAAGSRRPAALLGLAVVAAVAVGLAAAATRPPAEPARPAAAPTALPQPDATERSSPKVESAPTRKARSRWLAPSRRPWPREPNKSPRMDRLRDAGREKGGRRSLALAAAGGHSGALKDLALVHLGIASSCKWKLPTGERSKGKALQLLRSAVMYGDRSSARHLAYAYGAKARDGYQDPVRPAARALGVRPDIEVVGALLTVARGGSESPALGVAIRDYEREHTLPSRKRAFRLLQEELFPERVEEALEASAKYLAADAKRLGPKVRAQLDGMIATRPLTYVRDQARRRERQRLSEALYLLHATEFHHPQSMATLGTWLLQGGSNQWNEAAGPRRVRLFPIAGLWRLVQAAEAGAPKGAVMLGRFLAKPPPKTEGSLEKAWQQDLGATSAALLLARPFVNVERERNALQKLWGEKLPTPPPTSIQAWRQVRAALPWARPRRR